MGFVVNRDIEDTTLENRELDTQFTLDFRDFTPVLTLDFRDLCLTWCR